MKTMRVCCLMAVIGFIAGRLTSEAMSFPPSTENIILRGHLNTTCVPHNGGTVYLQMEIITPAVQDATWRDRRPMNIAVVLDRSGSMADDRKIDYAKKAVSALVDRLTPNDFLSIVIYDDQIETLLPMQHVKDKSYIKHLVQGVYPRNSTNLGGGMCEGFRQIERNFKREYVNRVILLSDGLANTGITDPHELNRIASRYRRESISLSTMGVGLDYNENLLLGLAEHGGGNYYFVESPSQLASIFERELCGLSNVLAQNARIELQLGNGVRVNDVIGCDWNSDGDRWVIPVGDLYANEHREFTVELLVPEGTGTKRVATGILKFDDHRGRLGDYPRFDVSIHYTDILTELEKGKNWDTQAKVDVAVSTREVDRAMEALDAGHRDEAAQVLSEAKTALQSSAAIMNSAAGAPLIQQQMESLEAFSKDVTDEKQDARKVKKSIQYRNYTQQKKRE